MQSKEFPKNQLVKQRFKQEKLLIDSQRIIFLGECGDISENYSFIYLFLKTEF